MEDAFLGAEPFSLCLVRGGEAIHLLSDVFRLLNIL
jgi:hypothetical protein